MYCVNCGKEIDEDSKFCQYCGNKIGSLKKNNKIVIIISSLLCLLIAGFLVLNIQKNSNETTITIKNGQSLINNSFPSDSNFIGSKVFVKIKSPNIFTPVNKSVMSAWSYRLENNLYNRFYGESKVIQTANNKCMIYIPNEFDKKENEKILTHKPVLEFKKQAKENETLWEPVGINDADLENVSVEKDPSSDSWVVTLKFKPEAKAKFAQITSELVNKQLGIFIDNYLQYAPFIYAPITGGVVQISGGLGGFTYEEANRLATMLNIDATRYKMVIEKID